MRNRLGELEVADQVAGVKWLAERGVIAPDRRGIYGWSYGGYMAARCLSMAPDTFHAAVSGAGVVDWRTYDTAYTERYMERPQDNPHGYTSSSVLQHAQHMSDRFLLVSFVGEVGDKWGKVRHDFLAVTRSKGYNYPSKEHDH